jgi:hypothetical protein
MRPRSCCAGGRWVVRPESWGEFLDRGGEACHCGLFEQVEVGQSDSVLALYRVQGAGGQRRVAAELEEVLVRAYRFDPEQIRPEHGEAALRVACRSPAIQSSRNSRTGDVAARDLLHHRPRRTDGSFKMAVEVR